MVPFGGEETGSDVLRGKYSIDGSDSLVKRQKATKILLAVQKSLMPEPVLARAGGLHKRRLGMNPRINCHKNILLLRLDTQFGDDTLDFLAVTGGELF